MNRRSLFGKLIGAVVGVKAAPAVTPRVCAGFDPAFKVGGDQSVKTLIKLNPEWEKAEWTIWRDRLNPGNIFIGKRYPNTVVPEGFMSKGPCYYEWHERPEEGRYTMVNGEARFVPKYITESVTTEL